MSPRRAKPRMDAARTLTIEGLVLWRDGNNAVVSLQLIDGSWCRIMSCDCRGVFVVEASRAQIEALARQHRNMIQRRRRGLVRVAGNLPTGAYQP